MTITEALKIGKTAPREVPLFSVCLACGFTPLHVRTFLTAHLQELFHDRRVQVSTGLYGDLAGAIENAAAEQTAEPWDGMVVALEWPDLDPRLGYRGSGAWKLDTPADVVNEAQAILSRIGAAILRLRSGIRVAVSLPTVPLPPLFHTPQWQASQAELLLQRDVLDFAYRMAESGRATIVNSLHLAEQSAPAARFDLKSDLLAGLPYTIPHADVLARFLARALVPALPKKGIISDLDDTLWRGIVGEVGVEGIGWDLAGHAQLHGLYQKLLSSLAGEGVLIGIASKNDPSVVSRAFARSDLLLHPELVFPMEVHWNAKSGSVQRILETWNIAADSVIFVDDSPMELSEVATAHPGIECIRFPGDDPVAAFAMLRRIRDLCGRERISRDDTIRVESIRQGIAFRSQAKDESSLESFLQQVKAAIVFDESAGLTSRVLELVNKTNQFNLNGIRYTPADWERAISKPGALVLAVNYEDKFGPLGTISVIHGNIAGIVLHIHTWVLSCRAFTRRIEYQCLKTLFELSGAAAMEFDFRCTAKNGPVQDFFAGLLKDRPVNSSTLRLTRAQFEEKCPMLYQEVRVIRGAEVNG